MNFVLICCVQNVESCERMLGLKVGPARPLFLLNFRFACACSKRTLPRFSEQREAELAAAEIASAPRILVTTAGLISRTLKTCTRAFPLI